MGGFIAGGHYLKIYQSKRDSENHSEFFYIGIVAFKINLSLNSSKQVSPFNSTFFLTLSDIDSEL